MPPPSPSSSESSAGQSALCQPPLRAGQLAPRQPQPVARLRGGEDEIQGPRTPPGQYKRLSQTRSENSKQRSSAKEHTQSGRFFRVYPAGRGASFTFISFWNSEDTRSFRALICNALSVTCVPSLSLVNLIK